MRILGVLNVTPDSFSDGGYFLDPAKAIAHGVLLRSQGADLIDVGGESTRPGAAPVGVDEELRRIVPVIRGLVDAGVPVSVDTMRAAVAAVTIGLGAVLVNDVSGGTADPSMAAVVADSGAEFVVMHSAGPAGVLASYRDVVADVRDELARRVEAVVRAGVPDHRVFVDPGIGFSKDAQHNWALLRRIDEIAAVGPRVLVGASRKRFLRTLVGSAETAELDAATAAVTAGLVASGHVWGVRVHDVAGNRIAAAVAERMSSVST